MPLPTDIVAGDFGHISHHNDLHHHYNDDALGPWHAAENVSYDNGASGLTADQVQAAIDEIIASAAVSEAIGTWAAMQAVVAPTDGQKWYASDQGIPYRYNSAAAMPWQRMLGNIDEIWVTDHGAIGDGVTDDSDAIEAADLEAYNTSQTPYAGRGCVVYFPRVGAPSVIAGTYKITRTIQRHALVSWVGGNSRRAAAHGRSAPSVIDGSSIASPDPAVIITGNPVRIHDRNMGFIGNNIALKITQASLYSSDYCFWHCNTVANADNAALYIENSFWLTFDHWNAKTGLTAAGQFAVRMVANEDGSGGLGGPIQGVANTTFSHGVMDVGGAVYENRTAVQGGDSEEVVWEDVLTESQLGQAFLTILGGGAAAHDLAQWEFKRCVRADSNAAGTGPTDSQAFIKMDANGGAGRVTAKNWSIVQGGAYAYYILQCVGAVKPDMIGLKTDIITTSGLVFDPANMPVNLGIGYVGMMSTGPSVTGHSNSTPTLHKIGATHTAFAAGYGAQTWNRWAAGADAQVYGPGTGAHDTIFGRGGVGYMAMPVFVKAGVPADSDFPVALRVNGIFAINASTDTLYYRKAGVWTAVV